MCKVYYISQCISGGLKPEYLSLNFHLDLHNVSVSTSAGLHALSRREVACWCLWASPALTRPNPAPASIPAPHSKAKLGTWIPYLLSLACPVAAYDGGPPQADLHGPLPVSGQPPAYLSHHAFDDN